MNWFWGSAPAQPAPQPAAPPAPPVFQQPAPSTSSTASTPMAGGMGMGAITNGSMARSPSVAVSPQVAEVYEFPSLGGLVASPHASAIIGQPHALRADAERCAVIIVRLASAHCPSSPQPGVRVCGPKLKEAAVIAGAFRVLAAAADEARALQGVLRHLSAPFSDDGLLDAAVGHRDEMRRLVRVAAEREALADFALAKHPGVAFTPLCVPLQVPSPEAADAGGGDGIDTDELRESAARIAARALAEIAPGAAGDAAAVVASVRDALLADPARVEAAFERGNAALEAAASAVYVPVASAAGEGAGGSVVEFLGRVLVATLLPELARIAITLHTVELVAPSSQSAADDGDSSCKIDSPPVAKNRALLSTGSTGSSGGVARGGAMAGGSRMSTLTEPLLATTNMLVAVAKATIALLGQQKPLPPLGASGGGNRRQSCRTPHAAAAFALAEIMAALDDAGALDHARIAAVTSTAASSGAATALLAASARGDGPDAPPGHGPAVWCAVSGIRLATSRAEPAPLAAVLPLVAARLQLRLPPGAEDAMLHPLVAQCLARALAAS